MRGAAALSIAALLCLAGCGQTSSATKFSGAEGDVAQVVEDLQSDGKSNKPDDICTNLLAMALQERIATTGSSCAAEMKKAIDDADAFDLEVQTVSVQGATATARVKGSNEGKGVMRTFTFAREGARWRIVSFGSAG